METARASGMTRSLLDRLELTPARNAKIAAGVRQVAGLPNSVGQTVSTIRPNGLVIRKQRVSLGAIGIIFETRPNVTVDAVSLCLKFGNACILRGDKGAFHSNEALIGVLRDALEEVNLPRDCAALVQNADRESAVELMDLTEYLDVLIPRGGRGLVRDLCHFENAVRAKSSNWDAEHGDYILAVMIVGNVDEAMNFIAKHGTGHSEAIITTTARRFLNEVDAAAVYVNASTRFTDGGEFGLGAEIGTSSQKLHARGPMGLEELTTINMWPAETDR